MLNQRIPVKCKNVLRSEYLNPEIKCTKANDSPFRWALYLKIN